MDNKSDRIRQWEKLSEIVGFVMSFISMCFTIRLMRSFATDNTEYYLYIAFGATVQIAQVCLFVYAVYLNHAKQGGKAMTAFALFCLLFVLSLAGTFGSFIVSNKVQNNQELTQDERMKDMQARAKSLDRQIERSQELIEGYQARRMLTKGAIPEGKRLDRLNAERAKLSKEMAEYRPEGTSDSLYTGLAKLTGSDPETCKTTLFGLYAIALDLVSAVLLAFSLGFMGHSKIDDEGGYTQEPESMMNPKPQSTPEPAFQMAGKTPETAFLQNLEQAPVQYKASRSGKLKQPIGFTAKPKTQERSMVSSEVITAYIRAAYKGQDRPSALRGRRAIRDKIGIRNDETDHIHSLLKRRKIVEVRGKRTIPLVGMTEALARIA